MNDGPRGSHRLHAHEVGGDRAVNFSRAISFGVILAVCSACGQSADSAKDATTAKAANEKDCVPEAGQSADFVAVTEFIKATQPRPMRFLNAAATDSAVSESGFLAMQAKGPSYYYAGSEVQKKAVRDKLELAGPYPALLVVMRGNTNNPDGTHTIKLGGHFITGELNGKDAQSAVYTMSCGGKGWAVASKTSAGPS